jgi:hypothetical protein
MKAVRILETASVMVVVVVVGIVGYIETCHVMCAVGMWLRIVCAWRHRLCKTGNILSCEFIRYLIVSCSSLLRMCGFFNQVSLVVS